jgi:transposase
MQVMHPRCGALDVHKKLVVAGVRWAEGSQVVTDIKSFATTTKGLLELSDWLSEHGVTHVAMEATGVYWKPVWQVLSAREEFKLTLANAAHVKNVPGRKSDVSDTGWLLELHAHGLVRASFVPDAATQELRTLMRTRKQLVRERTRHVQRIHKTLEEANIKLDSVLCDVLGKSGRAMLDALVAGETDPLKLAALAHPAVKASQESLCEALRGRVGPHHRFLLGLHLNQIDGIDTGIGQVDAEVATRIDPFRSAVELICSIPGVSILSAEVILAEIGPDMSRFPTAGHLLSWAGLCPRQDESAGKRRSTRLRHGDPWLKTALIQCAWAASRKNASYLQAQFRRLKSRRGPQKAICAVAASILTAIYHMLKTGSFYADLGPDHLHACSRATHAQRLLRQLERLGYVVNLKPAEPGLIPA